MEWILSYCMEFIQCVKLNWTLCKHCYYIGVLLTLHTLLTSLFRFLSIMASSYCKWLPRLMLLAILSLGFESAGSFISGVNFVTV